MNPGPRALIDPFGRVVRDLRISVTDRCNFRCTYCMEEDMQWVPRSEVLTFEEIERIARICVERFGFDGIRLTGGEPTTRANNTPPAGHRPAARRRAPGAARASPPGRAPGGGGAGALRPAGLTRLNVSLDSLDRERFR